jgi:hypothetical protein
MSSLTRTKLILVAAGVALFAIGARFELANVRLAGIAVAVIAWLARFYRPPRAEQDVEPG